jgi:RNA polymerase sigma-70 factor (ECF subfamily)
LITEVDSQRTQDEHSGNIEFATPASTDELLVATVKLGDHQAFWELWTRHSNKAFKTTYRITGNQEDAVGATITATISNIVPPKSAHVP